MLIPDSFRSQLKQYFVSMVPHIMNESSSVSPLHQSTQAPLATRVILCELLHVRLWALAVVQADLSMLIP